MLPPVKLAHHKRYQKTPAAGTLCFHLPTGISLQNELTLHGLPAGEGIYRVEKDSSVGNTPHEESFGVRRMRDWRLCEAAQI